MPDMARRTPEAAFAAFMVVMLLVMMFPVYEIANSAEPIVMGLPFSMFWIVAWTVIEFIGLLGFLLYENRQ
jgi:hypothetical protein